MGKEKYRIVEQYNVFYVEKLTRFLFWGFFIPISNESLSEMDHRYMMQNGESTNKIFYTLDDAKKYVNSCGIKYHII